MDPVVEPAVAVEPEVAAEAAEKAGERSTPVTKAAQVEPVEPAVAGEPAVEVEQEALGEQVVVPSRSLP